MTNDLPSDAVPPNGKSAVIGNRRKKPPMHSIDPDAIPDGLKYFDRWLGWRWEWRTNADGTGNYTKAPLDARTGGSGSTTDSATWSSFRQAMEFLRAGSCDGIGFVLGEADGGVHFAGIDLDDCRNPETGELSALARDILGTMDSYAEISPTGTGIKIFCYGKLTPGAKTKNKAGTVEIYSGSRYFTVTGLSVGRTPHGR